jgi:hypothetical protein
MSRSNDAARPSTIEHSIDAGRLTSARTILVLNIRMGEKARQWLAKK